MEKYHLGVTFGTFDLLHAGHVLMLQEAKRHCDYLVVGLQSDPTVDRPGTKNKPVQSLVERFVQLKGVRFVDEIIPYQTEQEVEDILLMYPFDVRIIGAEYKHVPFTGRDICARKQIEIVYNSRHHRFSSSELRQRVQESSKIAVDS